MTKTSVTENQLADTTRPEPKPADDVVFVRGVGSHNGGAELLLRAVQERMATENVRIAADVRRVSTSLRHRWDIGGYLSVPKFGRLESLGVHLLPRRLARQLDLYSGRQISGVLDASGFAVGDQWNPDSIQRDAQTFARLRRRGHPIVLLPQAFGPFMNPVVATAARQLFSQVDLICARDKVSFDHVAALRGTDAGMLLSPDITIALETHSPAAATLAAPNSAPRIAIVPNVNLSNRSTDADAPARYAQSLLDTYRRLAIEGYSPFFLIHSAHGDPGVVAAIQAIQPDVEVIVPSDGLEAKRLIGSCAGIIAGRYHAIVSALSQGVPAVAHSWSHKYGALLEDFGVTRGLVDPMDATASVAELQTIASDPAYAEALASAKPKLVGAIDTVWRRVETILTEARSRA